MFSTKYNEIKDWTAVIQNILIGTKQDRTFQDCGLDSSCTFNFLRI